MMNEYLKERVNLLYRLEYVMFLIPIVFHLLGLNILPRRNQLVPVLVIGQSQQLYKPCFHPPIYSALQGPEKKRILHELNQ